MALRQPNTQQFLLCLLLVIRSAGFDLQGTVMVSTTEDVAHANLEFQTQGLKRRILDGLVEQSVCAEMSRALDTILKARNGQPSANGQESVDLRGDTLIEWAGVLQMIGLLLC